MNASAAKRKLSKVARTVGGAVEEDCGYRTMNVFQVCAPSGMVWEDGPAKHIRCEIDRTRSAQTWQWNAEEVRIALERMALGLRPIGPEEIEFLD